jgi:hypothetical protein
MTQHRYFNSPARTEREQRLRLALVRADYWRWLLWRYVTDDPIDLTIARCIVAHYASSNDPLTRYASGRVIKPEQLSPDSAAVDARSRTMAAALLYCPAKGPRDFVSQRVVELLSREVNHDWQFSQLGPLSQVWCYAHTEPALAQLAERFGVRSSVPSITWRRVTESEKFKTEFPSTLSWKSKRCAEDVAPCPTS